MPEHTDFSVTINGFLGALHSFSNSKVLMVCREDLHRCIRAVVKANEIPNDIEQSLFRKHAVDHRFPSCSLSVRVIPVCRLPCNEAILIGGYRSNTGFRHITHNKEHVWNK